jgi:protease I
MVTIILVVAHTGFQPLEYAIPKKILTNAGFTVITASTTLGTATSSTGDTVKVDLLIKNIDPQTYDGIFFVGGPGALDDLDNQTSYTILQAAAAAHKPYGAICISPRILAHAGVLKNKKATGWDDDGELADIFKKHSVTYVHKHVVVDSTIITATGPAAAQEFGTSIVHLFKKK